MADSTFSGDETAPFFGFLGAAAALVFSYMLDLAVEYIKEMGCTDISIIIVIVMRS
uniref:Uncharacterized protein n=1 Tax=Helianthus annuus TaxID=4232 RepID=A0A251T681_HELAN